MGAASVAIGRPPSANRLCSTPSAPWPYALSSTTYRADSSGRARLLARLFLARRRACRMGLTPAPTRPATAQHPQEEDVMNTQGINWKAVILSGIILIVLSTILNTLIGMAYGF